MRNNVSLVSVLMACLLAACSRHGPTAVPPPPPPPPPPQVHWITLGADGVFWSVDRSAWTADAALPSGVALLDGVHRAGITIVGNSTSLWTRGDLGPGAGAWSEYGLRPFSRWGGIATDQQQFVAVATESVFGRTYRSTDGVAWTEADLPDSESAHSIGWSGERFFVGGRLRSVMSPARWTGSPDLGWMTWRMGQMLDPDRFGRVAPGTPPVAYGTDNAGGFVAWRVQGEDLLGAQPLAGGIPTGLAYGAGRWVIVGRDGADGRVWWSDDGAMSWISGATGSGALNDVAFGEGRFVAVGDAALVLESLTGASGAWTATASPPGAIGALARILFVP